MDARAVGGGRRGSRGDVSWSIAPRRRTSNGAARSTSRSATPLADSTNAGVSGAADEGRVCAARGTVERDEADAVEMPKAIRFAIRAGRRRRGGDDDYDYDDDGDDGNELDAGLDATQRTRRRIRAPLWSMAGHGGRDEPLPDSLLALPRK